MKIAYVQGNLQATLNLCANHVKATKPWQAFNSFARFTLSSFIHVPTYIRSAIYVIIIPNEVVVLKEKRNEIASPDMKTE